MDFLEDFLSEVPAAEAPAASKFKPKAKAKPKKGPLTAAKPIKETASIEAPAVQLVFDNKAGKEIPVVPDVSFSSSPPFTSASQLSLDEVRISPCLDTVEIAGSSSSGNRTVSLKLGFKGQDGAHDLVEDIADLSNDPLLSSENENVTEDVPIHAEESDRVSDPSPERPCGAFSEIKNMAEDVPKHAEELDSISDPSPERSGGTFSLNAATAQSEQLFSREMDLSVVSNILDEGEEHESRKTLDASHSSDNEADEGHVLSSIEAHAGGSEFSDGINKPRENSKSPSKANKDSGGKEKIKKKRGRKAAQVASEKGKPARKRKKAAKETEQSNDQSLKKFPHSTTRRKRCVDKSLLEAAEDSLDLQKLPIKDLILLAEHRERAVKKQVASEQPTSTNESEPFRIDRLQPEDAPYDDDETFGFDQDRDSIDEPSVSGIQTDTGYFNYHTHMQKKSRAKWSKKDTELFYQGIRQFGSDLSMIEQLFPGRTRGQMKLKFKKEERENPMMIQDAMANKSKDFSQFQLVIERLQEAAAEREQDYSDDDDASHLVDRGGKLDGNLETDASLQEAGKAEQNVQDATAHEELPETKDESPRGFYDEEEDSEYQGLI